MFQAEGEHMGIAPRVCTWKRGHTVRRKWIEKYLDRKQTENHVTRTIQSHKIADNQAVGSAHCVFSSSVFDLRMSGLRATRARPDSIISACSASFSDSLLRNSKRFPLARRSWMRCCAALCVARSAESSRSCKGTYCGAGFNSGGSTSRRTSRCGAPSEEAL